MEEPLPFPSTVVATPDVDLSIVLPVYEEAGSLMELLARIQQVAREAELGMVEVIYIDDGSRDASWRVIRELHQRYPGMVRALRQRRNFGKAEALARGFAAAKGKIIISMDADLQDQPEEIPKFLEALENGHDLVSGWKRTRHDPLEKTLPSRGFNWLIRKLSGVPLHDINCGFKAYRAEVAKSLKLYGEMHRFIPLLAHAEGWNVAEVEVRHQPRLYGRSKYGTGRMAKGALDLLTTLVLTRYMKRPAHFFGGIGLVVGAISLGVLGYLSLGWLLGERGMGTRPLFFFGILGTLLSAQLVSLGLLAELVLRRTLQSETAMHSIEELE